LLAARARHAAKKPFRGIYPAFLCDVLRWCG